MLQPILIGVAGGIFGYLVGHAKTATVGDQYSLKKAIADVVTCGFTFIVIPLGDRVQLLPITQFSPSATGSVGYIFQFDTRHLEEYVLRSDGKLGTMTRSWGIL